MVIIGLGVLAITLEAGCARKTAEPPPAAPVTTTVVASGDIPVEQVALGQVQAFNTAVARAQVSGQIVKVQFTEGQTVRQGDPIVQIDPRPLQAAVTQDIANAAKGRAALDDAVTLLNRETPLTAKGLVSAQQLDTQGSQVAELRAALAADRAVVQRDRLQLDFTSVRAPIAGVTGLRLIDVGNLVGPNDPQGLVTVTQIQPIAVILTIPQAELPALQQAIAAAGQNPLEVDAYAQGGAASVLLDQGQLTVLNNQIDAASGTVTLKAVFPNLKRRLWPGEAVEAHVVLARPAGLNVPASAVQRNTQGAYVWVVQTGFTAALRPVQVGPTLGDKVTIVSGLSAGETVVTDGQFGLTPGRRVAALRSDEPASKTLKRPAPESLGLTP